MKMYFSRIEGKDKRFWGFLGILIILALAGAYYSYIMFTKGYYITGMTNNVPWGIMKVLTIYFIGLSAGSLILSSLSVVFGKKEYKPFARVAAYLAAILLIGALISLGFNLGRPERVLELFFHPNPESILSWNALFYTSYIFLCFVYIFAMEKEMKKTIKVLGVIAVFIAILVHSGTGGIFGFIRARELYHSPLTPPSFVAAALSSGTALIIVLLTLTFKCTNRFLDQRLLLGLSRLLAVFIIVVLYFLFVENLTRIYAPDTYYPTHFMLFSLNEYSLLFWIGLILIGCIIPLIILFHPKLKKEIFWVIFSSILVVCGVFCERYIILFPGQVYPLELFPGKHIASPFMDGAFDFYCVSFPEFIQVVSVFAMLGILYVLGLKILPLLPKEARIEE
ncbi:MAG: NrfD/PsrC family molybdoenzyme membrane anchor subunit [bacterium]